MLGTEPLRACVGVAGGGGRRGKCGIDGERRCGSIRRLSANDEPGGVGSCSSRPVRLGRGGGTLLLEGVRLVDPLLVVVAALVEALRPRFICKGRTGSGVVALRSRDGLGVSWTASVLLSFRLIDLVSVSFKPENAVPTSFKLVAATSLALPR